MNFGIYGSVKYYEIDAKKRFDYIFRHYAKYEILISNMLESLVYRIKAEKDYNRMIDKSELGVGVVEDIFSDSTAMAAIENYEIENAIRTNQLSEELLKDVDEIRCLIFEWQLMKQEYDLFCKSMEGFRKEDKEILLRYLKRECTVCELADECFMEPEAIAKRVQRLKKKMKDNTLPFWKNY